MFRKSLVSGEPSGFLVLGSLGAGTGDGKALIDEVYILILGYPDVVGRDFMERFLHLASDQAYTDVGLTRLYNDGFENKGALEPSNGSSKSS